MSCELIFNSFICNYLILLFPTPNGIIRNLKSLKSHHDIKRSFLSDGRKKKNLPNFKCIEQARNIHEK